MKFSRSEVQTLRRCEREWYYTYGVPNGTPTGGYHPTAPILPLLLGTCIHRGMEWLFKKASNLDNAIQEAWAEWDRGTTDGLPREGQAAPIYFVNEQKALIAAFLWAFRVQHWDGFNNQYEIVQIEEELEAPVGILPSTGAGQMIQGVWFQARCDLVVRERESGLLFIPDWKVVKDARYWATKWQYESQSWSQPFAVEAKLGEQVAGCLYYAFVKGDRRKDRQCSVLVYGWKKEIAEGVWEYDCEERRAKGWVKFPVWEENFPNCGPSILDRVRFWVNWLPEEVRAQQFCISPPVLRDQDRITEWIDSSARLMAGARMRLPQGARAFDANRDSFKCEGCFAKKVCYGESDCPAGDWKPREDHHGPGGG